MRLRFLGTGTSFGVPQIGCDCVVCRSTDPRDQRMHARLREAFRAYDRDAATRAAEAAYGLPEGNL